MARQIQSFLHQGNTIILPASLQQVRHPAISPYSEFLSFENALFLISDYLTEAVGQMNLGRLQEARRLFAEAEIFASLVGNEELVHLVQIWRRDYRSESL